MHARAARRLRRRGRLAHTEHAARASREHTSRALRPRTRQQRYGCWGGGGHGSRLLVASIQCETGRLPGARAAAALAGARRVWRVTVYTCTRAGMCVMSHHACPCERHVVCFLSCDGVRSLCVLSRDIARTSHILERDGDVEPLRAARPRACGRGCTVGSSYDLVVVPRGSTAAIYRIYTLMWKESNVAVAN